MENPAQQRETKQYEIYLTADYWYELRDCRDGRTMIRSKDGLIGLGRAICHYFVTKGLGQG
ncbi:MAG TPA: hypothetical protein VHV29_09970 [Terriglobales bacterium]|jgi:hypothetical protein|nr:hypothetical protein [Terriglobales bacterium]